QSGKQNWVLSPDGKTLIIGYKLKEGGRSFNIDLVYDKQ
ncbi:MAG: hypothetical protein JWQ57_966, partial [Mucilaginibacter sp.]|nr:hypothetical protein [Mucilaginibacter sp.]